MPNKIKVAIIGVGNSASIFVQGIASYKKEGKLPGLWHPKLGGYNPDNIEVTEAFDINPAKIGKDLSEAIFIEPNKSTKHLEIGNQGIFIRKGIMLDKLPEKVAKLIGVGSSFGNDEIAPILKKSGIDVVLNLIPSGLDKTSKAYAEAALQAGCSFINCTPSPIACDPNIVSAFKKAELLLVGDDLMSQFGGTAFHRGILGYMSERGIKASKSYQLDVGGGVETMNTIDEKNKGIKRNVKTSSISVEAPYKMDIVTGTTEYVDFMGSDRTSYYWITGKGFLGSPIRMDLYLRTNDGANAANILLDTIRSIQISKERGKYGAPNEICAYGFKSPPKLIKIREAQKIFSETYLS